MGHVEASRDVPGEVRLTLLGGVEAHCGDQYLSLGPPQRRAVLCALVFRRRQWTSAHALLDALYEEDVPASGVAVIQTHVAGLRRVLEPDRKPRTPSAVLLSGHGGYQLRIADAQTDLGTLDRLVAEAERARGRADLPQAHRAYTQAVRLYRGEPLAGVPGPHAARWRDALAERRLAVLEDSIDVMIALGRFDQAIDQLRALTTEHPLRERLRALLMRALHLHGRQSEALEVYTAARRLLADQLGVDPGHELRSLHALILAGQPVAVAPAQPVTLVSGHRMPPKSVRPTPAAAQVPVRAPIPASITAPPSQPAPERMEPAGIRQPLPGRDSVLARILALVSRAAGGDGGLVVVSGNPGHGKSRLLEEVARRVPSARRVHSHPDAHADRPLGLVGDILEQLGPDGADTALAAGPHRPTVGEVAELVCRLATDGDRPLVILVDDASTSGERSSRLLSTLARRLRTSRVLLVLAVDERPWNAEAAAWQSAVEAAATAVLRLSALDEPAVAELFTRGTGLACPDALGREIHLATAGVPLLVVALVTDLTTLRDPRKLPPHLPAGRYSRALAQMLGRYSQEGVRMLRALAVLQSGDPVPMEVLAAACEEPTAAVQDRCELLSTVGMLAAANPVALPHPLVANALRRLSAPQDVDEIRVAAAQQARVSGHSARQVARYLRGLNGPQWSSWTVVLTDAADECLRENLLREALEHLEAALRIVAPQSRDAVLVRLGQLEMWINPAAALAHFEEALRLQRAQGMAPVALVPLAWTMAGQQRQAEAAALVEEVIEETARRDQAAATALRASWWTVAALTYDTWSDFVRRLRAERAVDPDAGGLITGGILAWDDASGVRCSAQDALARFPSELAQDQGWEQLPRELVGILAHLALWAEDLSFTWQLCDRRDDRYFGVVDLYRLVLRTEVLLRRGDYRSALKECALVATVPLDESVRRPTALVAQYAHALLGLGRIEEADRWLTEATGHANPHSWELTVVKYVRGMVCSARGDARQAAAHFLDCGRRLAAWNLHNPGYMPWRSAAAVELVKTGEYERARELAAAEMVVAQRWNTPRTLGLARRAVALAADDERTLPLLEEAADHMRRSETQLELVPVLIDLALAHASAGDRQRAREVLREAKAFAASRGAALYSEWTNSHLDALGEARGHP
ncbi:hypothetical protein GCM10010329_84270 [Streptomyces spiroverticillatus]|uniref:OmpR/PhoB-type domain-containing protein n=1 Tax=Streptomyces finlayi TaxID=67296 RepID=A0A918X5H3_9ACTN|nr:BTAD domain-containing putative transcriptional regulator [Streptomyces finlayi]GHA49191.1 hypothetical protein GCM10010329_84270 [Streptomyces spiroverticillatus]GHD13680.1 hypothetical protein GCM10010334_72100 [Streptomyces finlayi]